MSPSPLAVASVPAVTTVDPAAAPTALAAAGGVDVGALRPFSLAIGATIAALLVGAILVAGAASFTRAISDDIAERPDLSFAAGFVAFFGLLVAVAFPLIAATAVGGDAAAALAGLVSFPGLVLWGIALFVGGCLGAVAVGDRLVDRLGGSSSLAPAAVVGAVVLGASQLVPVFGAVVAMGLATVAIGAVARRRFDVDERLFDGAEPDGKRTAAADVWNADRAEPARGDRDGGLETAAERSSSRGGGGGGDGAAPVRVSPENDWEWDIDTDGADRNSGTRDRDDNDGDAHRSDEGEESPDRDGDGDGEWTVDRWEWGAETDEDGNGTGDEEERPASSDDDRRTW